MISNLCGLCSTPTFPSKAFYSAGYFYWPFATRSTRRSVLRCAVFLQDPKHRHHGSHRRRKDDHNREDVVLLWLYEGIRRCMSDTDSGVWTSVFHGLNCCRFCVCQTWMTGTRSRISWLKRGNVASPSSRQQSRLIGKAIA